MTSTLKHHFFVSVAKVNIKIETCNNLVEKVIKKVTICYFPCFSLSTFVVFRS